MSPTQDPATQDPATQDPATQDPASQDSPAIFDLQSIAAERRVNVVRIAGITVFYFIHFIHATWPRIQEVYPALTLDMGDPVPTSVHICVTVLCLGWLMQCLLVVQRTNQGKLSAWFGIGITLGDLAWLTALLCLSRGSSSPMISGYFLIIMLTGIRFDLRLTRYTTIAAGLCYLFLLGATRWPFGIMNEIKLEQVPRYHQAMTLIAIVLSGIIVGQIVRHAYQIGNQTFQQFQEPPNPEAGQEEVTDG